MSGSLTHSPADVIRYLLEDIGQGKLPSLAASSDWPIYVSNEPDTPDSVITVYDTEGRLRGRIQYSGTMQEHFGVQVRIRAPTEPVGYTKARAIATALDESIRQNSVTIASSVYLVTAVTRTTGVLSLGKEPTSNRFLFTINAIVALRQTT